MNYWFNVGTGQVETDETRSPDANVLGPYRSAEEAANALDHARENTEKWDADDRAWDERNASGGWKAPDKG